MNNFNETLSPVAQTPWRFSSFAVGVHWGSVLVLALVAALGFYMMSIEHDPGAEWYFAKHKSLGLVFALLLVMRLAWRLFNRPAPFPLKMPKWQEWLASGTQFLLYVLMVLMPLTGYLGASYSEHGVQLFGAKLPTWTVANHDTAEWFLDIHSAMIWMLVVLVAVHVAGALKHMLLDRDGTFKRMWFKPATD
jgi:cytochrome b561